MSKAGSTMARQGPAASYRAVFLFGAPLLVLALGHMLSNLLRTLPAVATDVIGVDIGVTAASLASLTGAYHIAFAAGQIPVGVALDRYGVRTVSLTLLSIVTIGAVLAATVGGASGFLVAQVVLGIGCCGMLLCPMTLAAKLLTPQQFGLWSGLIQGVGNTGMLLSASPLAWLIEHHGWRAGFWAAAIFAVIIAALVTFFVSNEGPGPAPTGRSIRSEAQEVVRIGLSPQLRGIVVLAFSSFAAAIAVRGLWGGPWLMDVRHLGRIEAGNALLPLTIALVVGPMLYGVVDRRSGSRRNLLVVGHLVAALALFAVAFARPGGWMSQALGSDVLPVGFDVLAFLLFGAAIAVQPLLFAMGRAVVAPEHAGKALAAINLSFFAGAAVVQALTSPIAAAWGLPSVMVFLGVVLLAATWAFAVLTRKV